MGYDEIEVTFVFDFNRRLAQKNDIVADLRLQHSVFILLLTRFPGFFFNIIRSRKRKTGAHFGNSPGLNGLFFNRPFGKI